MSTLAVVDLCVCVCVGEGEGCSVSLGVCLSGGNQDLIIG